MSRDQGDLLFILLTSFKIQRIKIPIQNETPKVKEFRLCTVPSGHYFFRHSSKQYESAIIHHHFH